MTIVRLHRRCRGLTMTKHSDFQIAHQQLLAANVLELVGFSIYGLGF